MRVIKHADYVDDLFSSHSAEHFGEALQLLAGLLFGHNNDRAMAVLSDTGDKRFQPPVCRRRRSWTLRLGQSFRCWCEA